MDYMRMAIVGQCEGQEVVAVLYYAETNGLAGAALDPDVRQEMANLWEGSLLEDWCLGLATNYTATELQVSAVNELNESISNYTVFQPANTAGTATGDLDGVSQVGIIGFQVSYPFVAAPVGMRVPKRSYLAYGPITSDFIQDSGAMIWTAGVQAAMSTLLVGNAVLSTTEWHPVRVGVPNELGVGAIGWVENVIFRPYSSDRKSRRRRPNGR